MPGFHVVPAAYLLLVRAGRGGPEILLQLRGPGTTYMAGHWATAAAGHVEAGESVFEAAVREAREELGVEVDTTEVTSLCAMHRTQAGSDDPIEQRVDFFFITQAWEGEPTIQEPDKCTALRWFPLAELPAPVVPHEHLVFERFAAGQLTPVMSFGFSAGPGGPDRVDLPEPPPVTRGLFSV